MDDQCQAGHGYHREVDRIVGRSSNLDFPEYDMSLARGEELRAAGQEPNGPIEPDAR